MTTPLTPETIARLRELRTKAGDDWQACCKTCMRVNDSAGPVCDVHAGDWGDTWHEVENGKAVMKKAVYGHIPQEVGEARQAFIAESHAALPALLDEVERLREENRRLLENERLLMPVQFRSPCER